MGLTNPAKDPCAKAASHPHRPPNHGVVVVVSSVESETVKEVANDDGGVDDTDDDCRRQHKRKANLLEQRLEVRHCRRLCVLAAVIVDDDAHQRKEDELGNRDGVQRLGTDLIVSVDRLPVFNGILTHKSSGCSISAIKDG